MSKPQFTADLIAPCGMNCGLCRAYLAYKHGIPRQKGKVSHCQGCRPRDIATSDHPKNCYIKRGCKQLTKHQIQSCSQCMETMPCKNLAHLDKRYCERYAMSMVENIKQLKAEGMEKFLDSQRERFKCPSCGDVVCVHDGKCYSCGYKRSTA
jgi:hypothetical protein